MARTIWMAQTHPRPIPSSAQDSRSSAPGFLVKSSRNLGQVFQESWPSVPGILAKCSRNLGQVFQESWSSVPGILVKSSRILHVTIYFGTDVETCVLETIIRDSGIGTPGPDTPVSKSYMRSWSIAKVECSAPLQLIDLRADGCIKNKIPTDAVRSKNHVLGQIWAHAIHEHPQRPDGIIFSSRLNEGGNIALFGRAMGKMYATSHAPLFDYRSELAAILTTYKIALT